jgi:hypothetical protein
MIACCAVVPTGLTWNRALNTTDVFSPGTIRSIRHSFLDLTMLSLPPRFHHLVTGSIVVLVVHLATGLARGGDFNHAMDQFAGRIKELLDAERESAIALNQFNAPARLAANSSSGIRKALEEGLRKQNVQIKKTARLEINGEYREFDDVSLKKTVVRILGRIVDQDSGRPVSECEVKVDNLTSIASLIGATMELPPSPVPEDRERAIRDGIRKPTAHVATTRISAGTRSPFAIEILAGPAQAAELHPRAPSIEDGQAFMNIRGDERYEIVLINDSAFDVAVTLTIDGLSLFAFGDHKDYTYVIVPQHSRGLISGWYKTNEAAEQFVVTEYVKSAAGSKSVTPSPDLGVITACFAAAWPATGNPPPDEGMEGRSVRGTSRGPLTRTNFLEVERRTGRLRSSISVRYTKESDPKDLPKP